MASQQSTIHEFLAKPRQARPHSNVASVILIYDSSEESDDERLQERGKSAGKRPRVPHRFPLTL